MRKLFARLLVLLVVPVVAFAQADAASAAVSYGAAAKWAVSQTQKEAQGIELAMGEGWTVACNGTGAYKSDNNRLSIVGKIACDVDVWLWNDPEPGDLTDPSITIGYTGVVENTQDPCTYNSAPITGEFLSTQSYETVTVSTRCVVSEVCVDAYVRDPGNLARHDFYMLDRACASADLGPLPQSFSECPYGTPVVASAYPVPDPNSGNHARHFEGKFITAPDGSTLATPGTYWKSWRFFARTPSASGGPDLTSGGIWRQENTTESVTAGTTWPGPDYWRNRDAAGAGNAYQAPTLQPYGVWVYIRSSDFTTKPPGLPRGVGSGGADYNTTTDWGINDPANCVFYFGPKFRNDPTSDTDEPQGPLNSTGNPTPPETEPPDLEPVPPVTEGDECDFSFSDPTTWVSAGICKLVELIRELIDKVKDLPAAIWRAFRDGLEALFVPSDGFMDGKIEELAESFADSTLGNYLEVFESMVPSGGSGCEGPPVRIAGYGMDSGTMYPFSACSGAVSTLAATSRLILTVSVGLAAGFACVRILGRSLGWNPGIGGDQ